ncbi:Ribosomal RNA small subunit methyltransferase E [termite gut metagenome]|uniref:16S rRNA (uracil(1498)-N(3))-methyltransferase n=1 Tax=termite gut metagenome TaxID=433724 RepID=A0A5J4SJH0_9ZZZZ
MCTEPLKIRPDRLFYTPDIQTTWELPEEEAGHCIRVLRLSQGDEITLTDGKGFFYPANIAIISGKRCIVTIKEAVGVERLWQGHLHIAFAPAKNMDRNEWFAEKATEIGIDELTFLNCRFSERRVVKTERINRIMVSAVKQSLKARVPELNAMTDFETFVSQDFKGQKFIAHCKESERFILKNIIRKGENALVMIGPEGDFSEDEIKKAVEEGFIPVSLGKSRLRTETAALVACHILNLTNQLI